MEMKLRPKKLINLCQQPLFQQFEKQHFQGNKQKYSQFKRTSKDFLGNNIDNLCNSRYYAQILSSFINNSNIAKNKSDKCNINRSKVIMPGFQDKEKTNSSRKLSDMSEFYEQKKAQYRKTFIPNLQQQQKFNKLQETKEKVQIKADQHQTTDQTKELLNLQNFDLGLNFMSNFNINLYGPDNYGCFFPIPILNYNPFLSPQLLQMNELFNTNMESIPCITLETLIELYRQYGIYQTCNQSNIASRTVNTNVEPLVQMNKNQVYQKKQESIQQKTKTKVQKMFKRASYHVAIAYKIYMDNIISQGKSISSLADIDPTRHAKQQKRKLLYKE